MTRRAIACILLLATLGGCRSPFYRDQGALVGGLTGAGVGAAIGEHNDNPLAGAAIGAAVGTLTGAAVGDTIDTEIARNNAIIEQKLGRRLAGAVTIPQVIAMSQAGLSDQVIITHLRANGVAQPPTADDLITLKEQGVSDAVINAMQSTLPPTAAAAPPPAPPVIVREHYVAPPWWCGPPHIHRWWYRPRRPGFHWGFSFSN